MRFWVVLLAACVHAGAIIPSAPGMGKVHRAIATTSPEAQRHFDAGLALAYGFNFDEATYEFLVATRADESCAMCWWGVAYANGPNINEAMKQTPSAFESAQRAASLATTPVEKAITSALTKRYAMGQASPDDRKQLHHAYAEAMRAVVRQFPDDLDIEVLASEALMIDTPVGPNWNKDGTPLSPNIPEAQRLLEHALAADGSHIGAIHYYIHLLDNGPYQDRALPYADRLGTLAPGAGHLVHMPSHLYLHVGRYADAEDANRHAMEADKRYLAHALPGTPYSMFAHHPLDFLWHVLLWEGEKAEALKVGTELMHAQIHMGEMQGDPHPDDGPGIVLLTTYVRFGMWDEILAFDHPGGDRAAIHLHFARGLALVAKGKLDDAGLEAGMAMDAGKKPIDLSTMPVPPDVIEKVNEQRKLIGEDAAGQVLAAIAEAKGDHAGAIELLKHAVEVEDEAPELGEPPAWALPARQRLGAVLLAAGKPAEAAEVYRADLKAHPHNGWSLFGLAKATGDKAIEAELEKAWARADVKLTASVY